MYRFEKSMAKVCLNFTKLNIYREKRVLGSICHAIAAEFNKYVFVRLRQKIIIHKKIDYTVLTREKLENAKERIQKLKIPIGRIIPTLDLDLLKI
jgi:hypothetical protein